MAKNGIKLKPYPKNEIYDTVYDPLAEFDRSGIDYTDISYEVQEEY